MIKRYKYIIAFVLGCIAAIGIGKLVAFGSTQTSVDAWFLTLNITGQDVGDRMNLFLRAFSKYAPEAFTGIGYLLGHSLLEELFKLFAFFLIFTITKPTSIREIVFLGIVMGFGFATSETFGFSSATSITFGLSFILRALGHGLYSGMVALLFGFGYFTQMRWIDGGAKNNVFSWFIRYQEWTVQIILTLFGLILASMLHAGVNIFAALGGEALGVLAMMIIWGILILFLVHPDSARPYGMIIQEVDLLQQIADAEHDLKVLENADREVELPVFRKHLINPLDEISPKKKKRSKK